MSQIYVKQSDYSYTKFSVFKPVRPIVLFPIQFMRNRGKTAFRKQKEIDYGKYLNSILQIDGK